ncbi:MAG TPA: DUF4136 domain-containing protein [Gemmatimonadales bacterium]
MHTRMRVAIAAAAMVALASCAGQQVKTDYNPDVGFFRYHTFALVPKPANVSRQLLDERVRRAVENKLQSKGLNEVDRSSADLLVGYGVVDRKHTEVEETGYSGPWWHWRWGVPWPAGVDETVRTYDDGTVVVHLMDAKTHQVIWQGRSPDAIDLPVKNPGKSERQVDVAVSKILDRFPPKSHA